VKVPCAIRIFSESCHAAVSTFRRSDRSYVVLGKSLLNCEFCLMNKVSLLAFIFILPFGADSGELRNTYYWYCPRCCYRYDRHQTIDEIIENRAPEKPSYNSRNCADAHGSTYCYWVLKKETTEVSLDTITEYREKKEKMRKIKEENQKNPGIAFEESPTRKFNDLMWESRRPAYVPPEIVITNQESEKVKNFNTDLVSPAAPFEILKK